MKPLFLALNAKLLDYKKIQNDFEGVVKGRWVEPLNLHVTVNYFGSKYEIEELLETLPLLITPLKPFELIGLDYFASNKILFAKGENTELQTLSSSINDVFQLGETREFTPHVTLMRMKSITKNEVFQKLLEEYKRETMGSVENSLKLMQSFHSYKGVYYKSIKKF